MLQLLSFLVERKTIKQFNLFGSKLNKTIIGRDIWYDEYILKDIMFVGIIQFFLNI